MSLTADKKPNSASNMGIKPMAKMEARSPASKPYTTA
jgi:hypothetical protein